MRVLSIILVTAVCLGVAVGKADTVPKKTIALFTPEQIQRARHRLANEEPARQAVQDILKMAQQWAQFSDDYLRETIPPPQVPRAFNISFSGCPVCGRETFKYGNYGFETPLEKPWKVICPNCKSEFPSNDFGAFLKSGMKDRSLLNGDYPDDGWGWKKPGEEKKYWFVAYYCHWHWMRHIIPAVHNLARAYLLTGDSRYAHKALVMLCRIADYYPDMDHNKQSRYATEFQPSYTGKIVWGNIGGEDLLHRLILFRAGEHQAEYEIFRAGREGKRWRLWLGDYEFLRGRALVGEMDETQRTVRTPTVLALDAVAPVQGMAVSNEARTVWWRLKSTRRGEVALDGVAPLTPLSADADGDGRAVLLVWDFGTGDSVLIPAQADYRR